MIRVARSCFTLISTAVLPAVSAQAATASSRPQSDSFIGELLAILIPLVLIIAGLVFLLRVVRRRYGLSGVDAPLSVLQILPVGPRERVVLVKSRAGRVFAIGVGAHSVTFITDLDMEDLGDPAAAASVATAHSMSNIAGNR
ncbi:flagellar biosynthetic protein FliO [Luteimonas sp. 3794]|uniref:FliO/MopB family protein n=1 Tax=Luteimonas sp. 3794 TaxID=2817730 RepID=UPI0028655F1D|nr:flagellar biosynthetic protein FliO [Luteimonas sp. 3794]MDR6993170.1 flagellar biogenesis protein FliO [Luteimonas sp. 3794]